MQHHVASKTYGTVSPERQKQMTGLEFVRGLAEGTLPLNTMAETLRYDVSEAESGRVIVTLPVGPIPSCFEATTVGGGVPFSTHSCKAR